MPPGVRVDSEATRQSEPNSSGNDQQRQRHVAQSVTVAGGQAQVRLDRAGGGGAGRHAGAVGLPDRLRGGIGAADGLGIAQGCNGAAGHGRIQPGHRIVPGRAVEPAQAMDRGPQDAGKGGDQAEPARLQRQVVENVEGQKAKGGDHQRPERPEGTRQPFRPQTRSGSGEGETRSV